MESAQLIGLSRQAALRRQLDVVANNLANLNTAGFKAEHMLFEEHVMPGAAAGDFTGEDRLLSFVIERGQHIDLAPGAQERTGNPLDLAIDGEGWFAVAGAEGERYTRNGTFGLDAEGRLVTAEGDAILGDAGPITFGPQETDITVARDGAISSSAGRKGRLRLVRFEEGTGLIREGHSQFSATAEPLPADGARVIQGSVERSNVRAVAEMAQLIEVTRSYTNVARTLSETQELSVDAINRLGRLDA